MPLVCLAILLGAAAATTGLSIETFFVRLTSPLVVLLLILFISILFPAYMRIYYILLLDAKDVFTASERRTYQEGKLRWERYLLRAALVVGVVLAGLVAWVRWR
jgi:heme A synthase